MSTGEPEVVWVLEGYSKADGSLRTEHPINRTQILQLREVITPDADDPWMLHSYTVAIELWPTVNAILQCGPPHSELDYLTGAHKAE